MGYVTNWENRGVCITYDGDVVFAEFMKVIFTIHAHPEYPSLKYVIHDLRNVSSLDFASVDMTQLAAHELGARYTNPKVKVSLVTSNPGMRDMVEKFSSTTKLQVTIFDGIASARNWATAA